MPTLRTLDSSLRCAPFRMTVGARAVQNDIVGHPLRLAPLAASTCVGTKGTHASPLMPKGEFKGV